MKYAVEFKTATGWKRWPMIYETKADAWGAIHERRMYADHIERRVVEVES